MFATGCLFSGGFGMLRFIARCLFWLWDITKAVKQNNISYREILLTCSEEHRILSASWEVKKKTQHRLLQLSWYETKFISPNYYNYKHWQRGTQYFHFFICKSTLKDCFVCSDKWLIKKFEQRFLTYQGKDNILTEQGASPEAVVI